MTNPNTNKIVLHFKLLLAQVSKHISDGSRVSAAAVYYYSNALLLEPYLDQATIVAFSSAEEHADDIELLANAVFSACRFLSLDFDPDMDLVKRVGALETLMLRTADILQQQTKLIADLSQRLIDLDGNVVKVDPFITKPKSTLVEGFDDKHMGDDDEEDEENWALMEQEKTDVLEQFIKLLEFARTKKFDISYGATAIKFAWDNKENLSLSVPLGEAIEQCSLKCHDESYLAKALLLAFKDLLPKEEFKPKVKKTMSHTYEPHPLDGVGIRVRLSSKDKQ